jgi:hypothetical protein
MLRRLGGNRWPLGTEKASHAPAQPRDMDLADDHDAHVGKRRQLERAQRRGRKIRAPAALRSTRYACNAWPLY